VGTDESAAVDRRQFLGRVGVVSVGALTGCAARDAAEQESDSTVSATVEATPTGSHSGTATQGDVVDAISRAATSVELTDSSDRFDAVAAELAQSPVVGIGENSHGVAEFKQIPFQLVTRLVRDHGRRLVAIEGTLGDVAPVDEYVRGETDDLDAAVSALEFYFWRTPGLERLFEWLREFNEGRPGNDRVSVRGYDAQFYDVNATAVRSYLKRVDPAYLAAVDDSLTPLTEPRYEESDASIPVESGQAVADDLRERLRSHESEYVDRSSKSSWRLARRHVWTLERGLRFRAQLAAENFTQGKAIRDEAMAENVRWLRDWTGSDRAIVLGNSNHTMRGYGHEGQRAARMGQHLTDSLGADYFSLGMLFGTGTFRAPKHAADGFATYDVGGPLDDTLEATLAEVPDSPFFLDFEAARERPRIGDLLADAAKMQVTVPRFARRGAVALPEPPGEAFDGVVFVRDATPASFRPPA
jgi:erythromycin esterase